MASGDFSVPAPAVCTDNVALAERHLGARVLVVDDDPASLRLLGTMLGASEFQVRTAGSGECALALLEQQPFDAVISDLRMPNVGGLELLAKIREKRRHTAFLITTGVDDVETGVQALKSGADDYLVKPLTASAVVASIDRALRNRDLEQQVESYRHNLEALVEARTGELQSALQQIERTYEDTLQSLGAAIDLRDRGTAGHSKRVCRYSLEIAKPLGLSQSQMSSLARGAYLHDIGKLGIPDRILFKPGPLSPEERRVMQKHVQLGFDLVKGIPFLADAAEVILTHHECYDGTGYPRGLKDRHIPLGGRIFAIADTLDAMTSDRPYQRASSFESARSTIGALSGTRFDPQIVAVFLGVPAEILPTIADGSGDPHQNSGAAASDI